MVNESLHLIDTKLCVNILNAQEFNHVITLQLFSNKYVTTEEVLLTTLYFNMFTSIQLGVHIND